MDYKQIVKDWINAKNNIHYTEFKEKNVVYYNFCFENLEVCINKGLFRKIKIDFNYDESYNWFWVKINNIEVLSIEKDGSLNWKHTEPKEIIEVLNKASDIIISDTIRLESKKTIKQVECEQLCKLLR